MILGHRRIDHGDPEAGRDHGAERGAILGFQPHPRHQPGRLEGIVGGVAGPLLQRQGEEILARQILRPGRAPQPAEPMAAWHHQHAGQGDQRLLLDRREAVARGSEAKLAALGRHPFI